MGWVASQAVGRRWQTILPPDVPGGIIYGPTDGRASVIAGVGPRTVAHPGGSPITFTSAPDLQSKIDANPSNTVFIPSSGWTDWSQRVIPNSKNPRIYVPGAPGTRIFDAGARDLFCMMGGGGTAGQFEWYGGTLRNVGTTFPPTGGGGSGFVPGTGSIIRDVDVSDCHGAGVKIQGSNVEVGWAKLHDNGQDGLSHPSGGGSNALVHHVEFYGNGYIDPDAVPDHGGSGKWSGGSSGTIEYCYAHEVWDYGPWSDTGGAWTIRENVFEDCKKTAPFCEVMLAGASITHNWLSRNGEAATGGEYFYANVMTVACCDVPVGQQILIQYNHIEGAERLIALNNQPSRPNTKRVNILDNEIKFTSTAARVGGEDSQTVDTLFTEPTISWDRNKYIAPNTTSTYWHWDGEKTFTQWKATGRDTNSTIEVG